MRKLYDFYKKLSAEVVTFRTYYSSADSHLRYSLKPYRIPLLSAYKLTPLHVLLDLEELIG